MSSLLLTNSDLHRVSTDLTSQQLYVPLESGAEEQRLPVRPHLSYQGPHLGLESHVEHLVSLVQDKIRHPRTVGAFLPDEVNQAAGGGHGHLHAKPERLLLLAGGHAAVDGSALDNTVGEGLVS